VDWEAQSGQYLASEAGCYILFHLEWHVLVLVVRFVASGHLFFFVFSLLSPKNYSLTLFVVGILTSVLVLLIFNFCSWLFYRSFIYF